MKGVILIFYKGYLEKHQNLIFFEIQKLKQVRVGIIGTSWWADAKYLPSLARTSKAILSAFCGKTRKGFATCLSDVTRSNNLAHDSTKAAAGT
jgi:hypothetical protein